MIMHKAVLLAVAAVVLVAAPSAAQTLDPPWPDFTEEQRWERMGVLGTLGTVAAMAYAKDQGTTVEEFGRWWGDLFAPSWGQPGAYGPFEVMRGMRRNFLAWPGLEFEILSEGESAVSARVNRPWAAYFGESGTWYGVTLDEFETLNSTFMRRIGEYHGLAFEESRDGDRMVVTYSRR
jgi:hypothetical protein